MPDWVAEQYRIILTYIFHAAVDRRACAGIILLLICPSDCIIGQIRLGIGFFWHDFINICT